MKNIASIFWFRQDLRLSDNPGLIQAAKRGDVLPIYIYDEKMHQGDASNLYLHFSLESLNYSMDNHLNLYKGEPKKIIIQLIEQYNIKSVLWNKCYEPYYIHNDELLKQELYKKNIQYEESYGSYLWRPEEIKKNDQSYYKVFSAYKKKALELLPRKPLKHTNEIFFVKDLSNKTTLFDFKFMTDHSWSHKIKQHWSYGELSAQKKLQNFIENLLEGYKKKRDYPALQHTSMLSVHLHFGEISPHQIWESIHSIININKEDREHFLNELIWREFSCYLLSYFKKLSSDNFQIKFNRFPWESNGALLDAWKKGKTGYPIVDAGMRELWETGYMHNRVRMIVASFLVKNLMIHWHQGQEWFFHCLVDADLANNSASWQWVAGCGVDAAPYFRIFNPILQGEKFDSEGSYTKKFVPELKYLPKKYLFKPWEAPAEILEQAGVVLGKNYPKPIVDLKMSRTKALQAYKYL